MTDGPLGLPVDESACVLGEAAGLGSRHREAALCWRRDWVLRAGTRAETGQLRSGHEADRHRAMVARVAASARCGAVRRFLGARAEDHLRLSLIETMSFHEIARLLMPGDPDGSKKVAAQMSLLLDILASHYAASGALTAD